jgi:HD-GYP domain-containing protein (c-di-GMP phosphodiesterase class II)
MTTAGSAGSWVVLTAENLGVLATVVAVLLGYRVRRDVADVLAPIVAFEPLSALEVGLSPSVHAFVAALDRKDRITRDHVVRTSALALRVAVRAGMPPGEVRTVALGALLHDLGKLVVPSEILGKPGALTDDEFRQIRTHPEAGERILATAPGLADAAPYVRWHHERFDGGGYPDRLAGDAIPVGVAIVSVTDAWDAMTNTRQYRTGMDVTAAELLLRTGAGSQWHPRAVELVLAEVAAAGTARLDELDGVGRRDRVGAHSASAAPCGCLDEIFDDDARSLLGV